MDYEKHERVRLPSYGFETRSRILEEASTVHLKVQSTDSQRPVQVYVFSDAAEFKRWKGGEDSVSYLFRDLHSEIEFEWSVKAAEAGHDFIFVFENTDGGALSVDVDFRFALSQLNTNEATATPPSVLRRRGAEASADLHGFYPFCNDNHFVLQSLIPLSEDKSQ